jgi:hypothetical protein
MKANKIHADIIEMMKYAPCNVTLSIRDRVEVDESGEQATYILWHSPIATYNRQTKQITLHGLKAFSGTRLTIRRIKNIVDNL